MSNNLRRLLYEILFFLTSCSGSWVNTSTLTIGGSGVSVAAGTLCGSGTIQGSVAITGGVVSAENPVGTPSQLNISGNVSISSPATLTAYLNGTTAGTYYSLLNVSGSAALSNCTLSATVGGGYTATGYPQLIILNTANGVSGTFNGYAEGATVFTNANAYRFKITYAANGGTECVMIPRHQTATVFTGAGVLNAKQ
jgi:hypothetical protein